MEGVTEIAAGIPSITEEEYEESSARQEGQEYIKEESN